MNKCSNINTLGKRLRESLKEKEWSQDKLAKLIGQSKGTISNWCLDKFVPNVEMLRAIAEHLGVRMEWLERGTGERYAAKDAVACSLTGKVVGDVLQDIIEMRLRLDPAEAAARMGVTEDELVACLGLRPAPKWEMLQKILDGLGVSVDYLLAGRGPELVPRTAIERIMLATGAKNDWELAQLLGVKTADIQDFRAEKRALPQEIVEGLHARYGLHPAWVLDGTYPTHAAVQTSGSYAAAESAADKYEKECLRLQAEMARTQAQLAGMQQKIMTAVGNAAKHAGLDVEQVHALQAAVMNYEEWLVEADPSDAAGYNKIPGSDVIQKGIPEWSKRK